MRNFLRKIAVKTTKFFYGRNGFDELSKLFLILSVVVFLIYGFWPAEQRIVKSIISLVSWGLMIYSYFRILSKKVYKRRQENKKYLGFIKINKAKWKHRKTHKFFRCPECKTWLRVPKHKGKITITCVKCSTKLDKKT